MIPRQILLAIAKKGKQRARWGRLLQQLHLTEKKGGLVPFLSVLLFLRVLWPAEKTLPMEMLPLGEFDPVYRSQLDVQHGELPVLPLSIYGAVAMAHPRSRDPRRLRCGQRVLPVQGVAQLTKWKSRPWHLIPPPSTLTQLKAPLLASAWSLFEQHLWCCCLVTRGLIPWPECFASLSLCSQCDSDSDCALPGSPSQLKDLLFHTPLVRIMGLDWWCVLGCSLTGRPVDWQACPSKKDSFQFLDTWPMWAFVAIYQNLLSIYNHNPAW